MPVTVVVGNERPELVTALAGEGITTVADVAKLNAAAIRRLERAGALNAADAAELRAKATAFLKVS